MQEFLRGRISATGHHNSGSVSRVILNLCRQRAGEFHSSARVFNDDGGRAEADFSALAGCHMIADRGKVRVARRFRFQLCADTEPLEQRIKIIPVDAWL